MNALTESDTQPKKPGAVRVGVVGATGYVGGELLRLLALHPDVSVVAATSDRVCGATLSAEWPQLLGSDIGALVISAFDPVVLAAGCDIVFVALPHTRSMQAVSQLVEAGVRVVDMSADYRFPSASEYEAVYGAGHSAPELVTSALYGLPELSGRSGYADATLIASPGCYPTAALLALMPAVRSALIDPGAVIIVDALSGVSGAGRVPGSGTHYGQVNENATAYKVGTHRHAPEMAMGAGIAATGSSVAAVAAVPGGLPSAFRVLFTPHLAPMDRGILATVYMPLAAHVDVADSAALRDIYEAAYESEPFVTFLREDEWPQTKSVRGTNRAQVGICVDRDSRTLVAVSAIDNLVKGAAGQGVQAMNLMLGIPEERGLGMTGMYP